MEKSKNTLPSASSYITAHIALNPHSEAKELATIISKLDLILCLIPVEKEEAEAFITMLQEGLEDIRSLFNKGIDVHKDKSLEKRYLAFKRDALLKIEAYESNEVQSLLRETSTMDKSFIIDYNENEDNLGEVIFLNSVALFEAFEAKFKEISDISAEIPQGA